MISGTSRRYAEQQYGQFKSRTDGKFMCIAGWEFEIFYNYIDCQSALPQPARHQTTQSAHKGWVL